MTPQIVPFSGRKLTRAGFQALPALIERAGPKASRRFLEFFLANIRNKNTRAAYARAVRDFFLWCDERGLDERFCSCRGRLGFCKLILGTRGENWDSLGSDGRCADCAFKSLIGNGLHRPGHWAAGRGSKALTGGK